MFLTWEKHTYFDDDLTDCWSRSQRLMYFWKANYQPSADQMGFGQTPEKKHTTFWYQPLLIKDPLLLGVENRWVLFSKGWCSMFLTWEKHTTFDINHCWSRPVISLLGVENRWVLVNKGWCSIFLTWEKHTTFDINHCWSRPVISLLGVENRWVLINKGWCGMFLTWEKHTTFDINHCWSRPVISLLANVGKKEVFSKLPCWK